LAPAIAESSHDMDDLVTGDLKLTVHDGAPGAAIEVHWTGKSNDRQPAKALLPYVQSVFEQAAAQGKPVELHLERVEHFNSSTVAVLIQLIQEARRRTLQLELVYDAALRWQRMSFDTLKQLTAKDETIRLRSI
jgi:hypothetical protein